MWWGSDIVVVAYVDTEMEATDRGDERDGGDHGSRSADVDVEMWQIPSLTRGNCWWTQPDGGDT